MKIAPIRITIPTYQANILISNAILSPINQLQKACEMFKDYFHPSRLRKYAPSIYSMAHSRTVVQQRSHIRYLLSETESE